MKQGSWYFEGYKGVEEVRPDGKRRRKLVYVGEYYGVNGGAEALKRQKRICGGCTIASIVLNLLAQFFPSEGGMVHWLAIPSILSLVPMIFLVMGLINFLPAKEEWEIRVYYAGYRRMYRSGIVYLVLTAAWTVMELAYIALNLSSILGELHYFLPVLACTVLQAVVTISIRKHPGVVVRGPTVE